jgi:superfamily I DNA and/or RNA helicase
MVPSKLFYDDKLFASAPDVKLIKWSGLPNPTIPVVFRGCETEESWVHEGASWYNEGEIQHVVDVVKSLAVERPDIRQEEIAVITPWKEQVWRIRARLRSLGYHGVDVGHVEAYQGAEFRVTILSCVRSRSRFLESDRKSNTGVFNEPKRFNVAITRAKELLVIIGNANLLKEDHYWNNLLQVILRNNLYTGPFVKTYWTNDCISKIE